MKKELNKKSNQVTVLLQGSYNVDSEVLKKFIREEHCPLFYSLDDSGIVRFEWFLDENEKTGTLIEVFESSKHWEELGGKVSYFGKPHPEIYNLCFDKKEKVLAIGDNLRTDIKGANNLNLDCIFITDGVHRDEMNKISDLNKLLETHNVKIDFFQKELTW